MHRTMEGMNGAGKMRGRMARGGVVAVCASAVVLVFANVAGAAFSGYATLRPSAHGSGRTLSGQGVELVPGAGAGATGGVIVLSIDSLEVGGTAPWGRSSGALSFVHGERSLTLAGIRFDFARGALEGSLGGRPITVFRLVTPVDIDASTASVSLSGGRLVLTGVAARLLRKRFGLGRALLHRGVGQVSMGATETTPLPPGCTPVKIEPPYNRPPPPPEECVPDPSPETPPPPAP